MKILFIWLFLSLGSLSALAVTSQSNTLMFGNESFCMSTILDHRGDEDSYYHGKHLQDLYCMSELTADEVCNDLKARSHQQLFKSSYNYYCIGADSLTKVNSTKATTLPFEYHEGGYCSGMIFIDQNGKYVDDVTCDIPDQLLYEE